MGKILDGLQTAREIVEKLQSEISLLNKKPKLVVVLVGNDPASEIYVKNKQKKATEVGIESCVLKFEKNVSENELLETICQLNEDASVNAILIQLPLPKHISERKILESICPIKDADGFHPENSGLLFQGLEPYAKPCTSEGILYLLKKYDIEIEGKNVVCIGRSNIVGKPSALMMLKENATVTICHSKTKNLREFSKKADILIVASGQAKMVKADWIKENSVIVDVGINRLENGKIIGDVDFEDVFEKCSYITPVPKGVGPMTIAMLMKNTFRLFKIQKELQK